MLTLCIEFRGIDLNTGAQNRQTHPGIWSISIGMEFSGGTDVLGGGERARLVSEALPIVRHEVDRVEVHGDTDAAPLELLENLIPPRRIDEDREEVPRMPLPRSLGCPRR
jgi:hypothetical protein